jgi:hypothetical protein
MKQVYNGLKAQGHTSAALNEMRTTQNKSFFDERRVRKGKTQRDHQGGARKRNEGNKAERIAWQSSKGTNETFPRHTARGNGNSSKRQKYYG